MQKTSEPPSTTTGIGASWPPDAPDHCRKQNVKDRLEAWCCACVGDKAISDGATLMYVFVMNEVLLGRWPSNAALRFAAGEFIADHHVEGWLAQLERAGYLATLRDAFDQVRLSNCRPKRNGKARVARP